MSVSPDTSCHGSVDAIYRAVLGSIDHGFCIIEIILDKDDRAVDYRFLDVNPAFEYQTGLIEARGRTMREMRPDHEHYWFELYGTVALTGTPVRFEQFAEALEHRWFEVEAFRVGLPEQRQVAILFKDITDRKRSAAKAEAKQTQLHALFEAAPYGVLLVDRNLTLVRANPIARELLGQHGEVIGRSFDEAIRELLSEEAAQETLTQFRHTLLTGEPHDVPEFAQKHPESGAIECYTWRINRIPLKKDEFGIVCHFRNISQEVHTRNALLEADRRKDEFLATLAHELRNPLAALGAAAHLLAKAADRPAVAAMARDALQRQVAHMARLLDDLLDIARITRGRLELRQGLADIESVVEAAIETARPVIDQKNHHFDVEFPDEEILVNADAVRLAQVISNLLTNAAKYTDAGGRIRLRIEAHADKVLIKVRDWGIGMTEATLNKIFRMFSQEQSAINRSEGGLGIGLALAKGLMDLHAGTITAHSEGLGRGSEFIVCLPRLAGEGPLVVAPTADSSSAVRARRVLIADDNRDAADSLAMLLRDDGHAVIVAYDGEEAIRTAREHRPDVIVLDIGMPLKNGYDAARELRREPWSSNTKLIAISGWGRPEDREQALAAGFDVHLTKPVDASVLCELVDSAVGKEDHNPAHHEDGHP